MDVRDGAEKRGAEAEGTPGRRTATSRRAAVFGRRALDLVERLGNRIADPLTLFAVFAALVALASWLAALAGVSVVHPGTGKVVAAVNLLSREGVRRMLGEAVKNFAGFPPLG